MSPRDERFEGDDPEFAEDSRTWNSEPPNDEPPYGLIERQILFKLIAAHALVDPEFYKRLRGDPAATVAEMNLALREDDLEYLKGIVDWPVLDEHADAVREALHTDKVVRSLW